MNTCSLRPDSWIHPWTINTPCGIHYEKLYPLCIKLSQRSIIMTNYYPPGCIYYKDPNVFSRYLFINAYLRLRISDCLMTWHLLSNPSFHKAFYSLLSWRRFLHWWMSRWHWFKGQIGLLTTFFNQSLFCPVLFLSCQLSIDKSVIHTYLKNGNMFVDREHAVKRS